MNDVSPPSPAVRVERSLLHGRGVVAVRAIEPGDVVDRAPVLVVPAEQRDAFDQTTISEHCFEWEDGAVALPAGTVAFLNHSETPNARAEIDADEGTVLITATERIEAGSEVTIDYRDGDESVELWF